MKHQIRKYSCVILIKCILSTHPVCIGADWYHRYIRDVLFSGSWPAHGPCFTHYADLPPRCTLVLLHGLPLFLHLQAGNKYGIKQNPCVTPLWVSNQATRSTFTSVSDLVQMSLCVASFCAFRGCHHFYSHGGRSRCGGGGAVCYRVRVSH